MAFLPSPRHNLLKPPFRAMRSTEDLPQRQRKASSDGDMKGDSSALCLTAVGIGFFHYSAEIVWERNAIPIYKRSPPCPVFLKRKHPHRQLCLPWGCLIDPSDTMLISTTFDRISCTSQLCGSCRFLPGYHKFLSHFIDFRIVVLKTEPHLFGVNGRFLSDNFQFLPQLVVRTRTIRNAYTK